MRVQHLAPASIGVEEAPPHSVLSYVLHAPASVQESRQHALSELNNPCIFLGLCRFRRVIRERVLLGDRRNDQSGMKRNKRRPQRSKLRVPPLDLEIARTDCVCDVVSTALMILAGVCDMYVQLRVLPQYLLYPAVVAALRRIDLRSLRSVVVELLVAEIGGARNEVRAVIWRGLVVGWWGGGSVEAYSVSDGLDGEDHYMLAMYRGY